MSLELYGHPFSSYTWKVLIPLSLGWLLMLATINVARDQGWNTALVVGIGFVIGVGAYALLAAAIRTAQLRREATEGVHG